MSDLGNGMTDFSPEAVEARIQAAIRPQLVRADYLIAMYVIANGFEATQRQIQVFWNAVREAFIPVFENLTRTYNLLQESMEAS